MYDNPWTYNDQLFDDEHVGDSVGFVYLITDSETGKKYIGKKIFRNKVAKPPLKGKSKRRISYISSNWKDYYGSNDQLKKLVETTDPSRYKRQILHLCASKSQMSYLETKELFTRDALFDQSYFNDWVTCRITRKQLNGRR